MLTFGETLTSMSSFVIVTSQPIFHGDVFYIPTNVSLLMPGLVNNYFTEGVSSGSSMDELVVYLLVIVFTHLGSWKPLTYSRNSFETLSLLGSACWRILHVFGFPAPLRIGNKRQRHTDPEASGVWIVTSPESCCLVSHFHIFFPNLW